MPQIIVIADGEHGRAEGTVTLRERINISDFESHTFGQRLVERLGWAVGDAHDAERTDGPEDAESEAEQHAAQPRASASVVTTAS